MAFILSIIMGFFVIVFPASVTAKGQVALTGVNLAGAEFGQCINRDHSIYVYDELIEKADHYLNKGMNIIRLPFCWERLQNQLLASFNSAELARIHTVVDYVTQRGAYLLLDPHNYARYDDQVIGANGSSVSQSDYADFWAKLATEFADNDKVVFGIMNEPHGMDTALWVADANAAIAAIRNAGATNLIFVPGNAYTGAHSWEDDWYGSPNALEMLNIVDPADNFVIEVHQYFDSDSSGNAANPCVSGTIGSERLAGFTNWLNTHNLRGFLGEFGAHTTPPCLEAIDDMLDYMDANANVWMGWTYWAGGPWWGDYSFSLEPIAGIDRPQMNVLKKHLFHKFPWPIFLPALGCLKKLDSSFKFR